METRGNARHNKRMSVRQLPDTIFVHVPYIRTGEAYESLRNSEVFIEPEKDRSDHDGSLVTKAKDESLVEMETLNFARRYIYNYPTVYVVYSREKNRYTPHYDYTVYVGETNDIRRRTDQHARGDAKARKDWKTFANKIDEDPESVRQYIIGNEHFNKSLTLDIENRLMHYLLGSMNVRISIIAGPMLRVITTPKMSSTDCFPTFGRGYMSWMMSCSPPRKASGTRHCSRLRRSMN